MWSNRHTILHRTIHRLTISPNLFSFHFNQISPFTPVSLAFVFRSPPDTKTLYLVFCHIHLWRKNLPSVNYCRLSSYANWVTSLINDEIVKYRADDNLFYTYVQCIHTLVNVIFVYNSLNSQAFLFTPKHIHTLVIVHICLQLPNITSIPIYKNPSQKQRVSFSNKFRIKKTKLTR